MRRWPALFAVVILAGAGTVLLRQLPALLIRPVAVDSSPQLSRKPATRPIEPADVAAPKRLKDRSIDPHFQELQDHFAAQSKSSRIELLFLGDSITQGWSTIGAEVWQTNFAPLHAANFGSGGDRTQHLLWRLEHGEVDAANPKVVVLMIGTNNTDASTEAIVRAELKIVAEIRNRLPKCKLLLMGILPREYRADDPIRRTIVEVNAELKKLDDGHSIRFLDIGDRFVTPSGNTNIELLPDLLHPSEKGYQVWADAMRPVLSDMMKNE